MSDRLLLAEAARIDADGAPLLEALTASAQGPRVALVGDWQPFFSALGGKARVAAGRLDILGQPADRAVAAGTVGLAFAEPVLPPSFNAGDYLLESAALLGSPRGVAKSAAQAALASLQLAHLHARRIETLTLAERRALAIAHAGLGAPRVLALEAPLDGLHDERAAAWLSEIIATACHGRELIVSLRTQPATGPERALVEQADAVLRLEAGTLVASDREATPTRYVVTVLDNVEDFTARLQTAGARVAPSGGGMLPGSASAGAVAGGAARLIVELGGGGTDLILSAALDAAAPLLELVPAR